MAGKWSVKASIAPLHLEHEDDERNGSKRHHPRDPEGARSEQLRLRAERAIPAALRPRWPKNRLGRPVGDGGLQAASSLPQRGPLQTHLWHIYRFQEYRVENRRRVEAVRTTKRAGSRENRVLVISGVFIFVILTPRLMKSCRLLIGC